MNINIFKNYLASARASAFISRRFRTGRFFSLSNTGCIAPPGRNFLLSNPCSVWDCKGRNLFLKTKNIFLFFFFPLPRFRGPPSHQFPTNSSIKQHPLINLTFIPLSIAGCKSKNTFLECKQKIKLFYNYPDNQCN
jgi:hypothetical protein